MNCIVLRLSAIHATVYPWSYPKSVLIGGLLIHTFGIGLPIARAVRRGSREAMFGIGGESACLSFPTVQ